MNPEQKEKLDDELSTRVKETQVQDKKPKAEDYMTVAIYIDGHRDCIGTFIRLTDGRFNVEDCEYHEDMNPRLYRIGELVNGFLETTEVKL